jgi:hypothetical protein
LYFHFFNPKPELYWNIRHCCSMNTVLAFQLSVF